MSNGCTKTIKLDKPTILTGALIGATMLSIGILASYSASATSDSTIDQINITVPVSCSLSASGMNSHNASLNNNQYDSAVGTTTATVYCNDSNGFAIYAIGYTDDTDGKTVLTSSSLGSTYDIATGVATSGNDSKWAMKLATPSSPTPTYPLTIQNSFDSFHTVPDAYTMVAKRASANDVGTGAEGSTFTTTYQIYVGPTQPAGTYIGKVKYVLVHPHDADAPLSPQTATSGCINYFANASTAVGQMGCQRISTSSTSATLWAANFKRTGYGFAGWSDAFDYATNPNANFYGPNETITFTAGQYTGTNNGLALYAVWVKSAGTIQNWDGCNSLAQGATTALTDERDGNTYAVAKLADNKCWTIENLRLADKDSSNNDINLSSTNTHNPSLLLNNSWYYKNQQSTLATSNHLSATSDPTSTDPNTAWCQTDSSNCDDQSMLATNNTTLFTNNTSSSYSASSNVYSYGNYYNWYSTTAGHGKYGSSYGSGYQAPGDICPAGWHLPKGGDKSQESTNEFWQLIVTGLNNGVKPANYDSSSYPNYTGSTEGTPVSNALRSYPNNFVYSGYLYGSSVGSRNSYGDYWSASGCTNSRAYSLYFRSTYVRPGTETGSYKYGGRMVRCVAGS